MSNPVYAALTSLAACLCDQIESAGLPKPCFCGVVPGDSVVDTYGGYCNDKCGMAWVRLADAYPAQAVGQPSETVGNCGNGIGFTVEIGILRCYPVTQNLRNPSPDDWLMYSRTYDAQRFSPLAEIDRSNVAQLAKAWTRPLPAGPIEVIPLSLLATTTRSSTASLPSQLNPARSNATPSSPSSPCLP